ncbi:maleylpyruvate isomerase family mycothiol-dependent enzyme [Streptomyces sp. NPDC051020]|uniref:maleylpyruvate isomerase family mycothiol-dependent enzyme n=1 Tax=Streptomyces sp. NPDC051020 TaxID=3155409 RepID=UPI00342315EE
MTTSFVAAAHLPQTGREQSAEIAEAEGRATFALLRGLGKGDWSLPTDCGEWDVRTLVSHLVGQCEDNIRLRTMLRRQLVGPRRYPDKITLDAHMAVQIDDHALEAGPALVEQFALLWPRAVRARRRRPGPMRRVTVDSGIPGEPRMSIAYLLDVIYVRDQWMHRIDLARATEQPVALGEHDRHIVEQVVRDLALAWSDAPVLLKLSGPAGGTWLLGSGEPAGVVSADVVAYMRALSGRDGEVALELASGAQEALAAVRRARVVF